MQQATAVTRAPAGKWVIAGTVVLGSFVSVIDFSIAEIILVTMAAWFSSLLGRKRFFIYSFILFTAASTLWWGGSCRRKIR